METRKISIYSQNARGLNCSQKRRDVFQHPRQKKYNMQDVHIENEIESYITSEWGFKVYLAEFKSNKRGVLILLNNNFEQEVYRVLKDPNGNYIILEIKIKDQMITLLIFMGQMKIDLCFMKI